MGSGYLADDFGKIYTPKDGKNIYYFLNGKRIDNPANTVVESEDRLLVWYGTWTEEEVGGKFDILVPKDAHEYNQKADPASCSSNSYGFLSPIAEPITEWLEHHHD
jgi:hypothetical protein